jgi:hypothetical protein
VKKIDRRLKSCHALLAKFAGSSGAQPDAASRQDSLAAAMQRRVLEDRGRDSNGAAAGSCDCLGEPAPKRAKPDEAQL